MKSKTIILSPQNENSNARGILTLFTEDDLLKCRIRLYSIPNLSVDCKLGIYHNSQVYTANLLNKGGQYESSFVGDFNMDSDFYCAIINTAQNNSPVLAGGTYSGYYFNNTSVFEDEKTEELEQEKLHNKTEKSCDNCDKCASCKYKEYFYSSQTQVQNKPEQKTEDSIKKVEEKKAYPTILDSITPQFNSVFETYPEDKILNKLIPNGKFVEICENLNKYSIGVIYENAQIKYIAYALKSDYNTTPPAELGEHYQWLPLDVDDPLSEGYFLVFQDATDLKILEL